MSRVTQRRRPGAVAVTAVIVALMASVAVASITTSSNFISVTSTATTVDWTPADQTIAPPTTVCMANGPKADQTASANEVYIKLYACGENQAAATTSAPIVIQPGEGWVCITHNPQSEISNGYCGLSAITASTETATLRYFRK